MEDVSMTFDEFVEYGKAHTDNIVNGMPWSFEFYGCAHENDDLYLISRNGINESLKFHRGDWIAPSPDRDRVMIYSDNMSSVDTI
jgi:hypothetical protein